MEILDDIISNTQKYCNNNREEYELLKNEAKKFRHMVCYTSSEGYNIENTSSDFGNLKKYTKLFADKLVWSSIVHSKESSTGKVVTNDETVKDLYAIVSIIESLDSQSGPNVDAWKTVDKRVQDVTEKLSCILNNIKGFDTAVKDPSTGKMIIKNNGNTFIVTIQSIFNDNPEGRDAENTPFEDIVKYHTWMLE